MKVLTLSVIISVLGCVGVISLRIAALQRRRRNNITKHLENSICNLKNEHGQIYSLTTKKPFQMYILHKINTNM